MCNLLSAATDNVVSLDDKSAMSAGNYRVCATSVNSLAMELTSDMSVSLESKTSVQLESSQILHFSFWRLQ